MLTLVHWTYCDFNNADRYHTTNIEVKSFQIHEVFTDALFWSPGLATLLQHEDVQSSELDPAELSRYAIYFSQAKYGDGLNLLLGAPFITGFQHKNGMDRRLSQSLIQYMANFIHFGYVIYS